MTLLFLTFLLLSRTVRGCAKFALLGGLALFIWHRYPDQCRDLVQILKRDLLEVLDDVGR